MKFPKIEYSYDKCTNSLLIISSCFISICWIGLILSEFRIFYSFIVIPIVLAIIVLWSISLFMSIGEVNLDIEKRTLTIIIIVIATIFFNSLLFHDNFMGGIDSGTMSNVAVYLSRTGSIHIPKDQMLFPGLINVEEGYIVGFHLGYISWLGIQHIFFGLWGVAMGNLVPHMIGIGALFLIIHKLRDKVAAFAGVMLLETTYPMIWFTRGTFNEIFSFSLIMISGCCLIVWYQEKNISASFLGLFAIAFFMYVRIEAIALFITYVSISITISIFHRRNRYIEGQIMATVLLSLHYLLYTLIHIPWEYFTLRIDSSDIEWGQGIVGGLFQAIADIFNTNRPNIFVHNTTDFVFRIFALYGLLWIILIFMVSVPWYLYQTVHGKQIDKTLLIIFTMPVFIYLLTPFTDPWQPWFFKRYIFAIIPVSIALAVISLRKLLLKTTALRKLFIGIIVLGIGLNVYIAQPVLLHRDHLGAVDQVGIIASNFNENDVLLIDRDLAGFYKIAEPLFYIYGIYTMWIGNNGTWCGYDKINITRLGGYDVYVFLRPTNPWLTEYLEGFHSEFYFNASFSYSHLEWTINLHGEGTDYLKTNYTEVLERTKIPDEVKYYSYDFSVYRLLNKA